MNDIQAHRGPDDAGLWHDPDNGVGFAHRRLSIIDLSPAGHQPMCDVDRRAVITFNGEIYNYRELKSELEQDNYRFSSTTDTEVILNLYLRDGPSFLERLNGIFALAIWDVRQRRLLLARDGLGVKPLYYAVTPRGAVFASEIKALVQTPDLDMSIDPEALFSYVSFLYAPYPGTPLRSVRKLPPGHAAWFDERGPHELWQFYHLPYDQAPVFLSQKSAEEQLRHFLKQAVHRQMVADVPVGAFLSGGLDSSSIVAFAKDLAPEGRIDCFTVGFTPHTSAEEGMIDDLPYARYVAEYLDVPLHVVEVGLDMSSRFEKMVYQLDEPLADPASINVLLISQLARQQGIKVLLSGAGGDDIFAGYRRHYALYLERYWDWLPLSARRWLSECSQRIPVTSSLGRRLSKLFHYADKTPPIRLASYFLWIEPVWLRRLAGERLRDIAVEFDPLKPLLDILQTLPPGTQPLNQMLALDSTFFLTDHNLAYTDKMSMAAGVEVRVPFLDPDLVAFAARLKPSLKQCGSVGKWIFKHAMEPLLPNEVIYRPKTGFGAPLRRWLRNDLKEYVAELLSERSLRDRGLFDYRAVRQLMEFDRVGRIDAAYPIFALVCIELWMRTFIDRRARLQ